MENTTNKKIKLSRATRMNVAWHSFFLQGSWNYERMQNLGFLFALLPALKKFYPSGSDEAKAALKRHMEFFNTHPYPAAPIIGVTLALEEEKANGVAVDDAAIQGVKVGMMGPLAGVGDPVFWFTLRPIFGAIAASLAAGGNIVGPLFFFFAWNIVRIAFIWYTQEFGYKQGTAITSDLGGGMLQRVTKGASILGMFILGALIERWVNISFTGPNAMLPKMPQSAGAFVGQWITNAHNIGTATNPIWQATAQSQIVAAGTKGAEYASLANMGSLHMTASSLSSILGQFTTFTFPNTIGEGAGVGNVGGLNTFVQKSLSDVFNTLIPGFVALLLSFLIIFILRKWKNRYAPLFIIIGLFVLGILLYVSGLAA